MMPTHAWSSPQVCVTEQHWAVTHCAQEATENVTPQAITVLPPPPLPPPLPPAPATPSPPLDPPLLVDEWHSLLQLCPAQLLTACADGTHAESLVSFA